MSVKEKLQASAQKSIAKGQLSRAIKDYCQLVELDPKDIRNRQKLAELYSRARMTPEAIETFEGVARYYSDNGFYLKAISVYKQIQRLDPAQTSISLRLAELNQKQGLTGNALAEYRVLVAAHEKSGNLQGALQILYKMRDLEPDNLNIRVKIIETHIQSSAFEKARSEFAEAVAILESKQDNVRLLKLYEFFIPHFPHDPEMKIGQARILISKGDSSRAIALLTELLKEKPHDPDLLRQLANGYRHARDFAQETLTYRRLLQNAPRDLTFRAGLVRALLDGGEGKSALHELEGWRDVFLQGGQVAPLKEFYERLRTELPDEERVIQSLHTIYEATGEGGKLFDMISASSDVSAEPDRKNGVVIASKSDAQAPDSIGVNNHPLFAEESSEGAEEIPLEFLEGFGNSEEVEPEFSAPATEEKGGELEIEMELDLGFDFFELPEKEAGNLGAEATSSDEEEIVFSLEELEPIKGPAGENLFDLRGAVLDDAQESDIPLSEEAPPKKKGIKTDVEVNDPDSHYNLGIAYKEMGLLEEAVCEFDKALSEPSLTVPCLSLKGMCLVEMGAPAKAEESFKQALATPELDEEVRMGLLYELGLLYEGWNRPGDALEHYRIAAEIDPSFRRVEDKVHQLRREAKEEKGEVQVRKKERISYV